MLRKKAFEADTRSNKTSSIRTILPNAGVLVNRVVKSAGKAYQRNLRCIQGYIKFVEGYKLEKNCTKIQE